MNIKGIVAVFSVVILSLIHLQVLPERLLSGEVLAVNNEFHFVIISLGKKDGVRKGEKFIVYKDRKYKGKVEVEEVFRDMSSCNILPEYQVKEIKVGDMVIED